MGLKLRTHKDERIEQLELRVQELERQVAVLSVPKVPSAGIKNFAQAVLHRHQGYMSITKLTELMREKFSIDNDRVMSYLRDIQEDGDLFLDTEDDTVVNQAVYLQQKMGYIGES